MAEEGHGDEGGEGDEADAGIEEEPGKVGGGAAGGFFEEPGVALHEEDVEDEVEGERAEVEEGCCEAPELQGQGLATVLMKGGGERRGPRSGGVPGACKRPRGSCRRA